MKAHLVQLDIAWEDPAANHAAARRMIGAAGVKPGDLVLLPEMFDTGFSMNTSRTGDVSMRTFEFLRSLAGDLGITVQGGRTCGACRSTRYTNVMTVFAAPAPGTRAQCLGEYEKTHLFPMGKEPEAITRGERVITYAWMGHVASLIVCPAICYDLRFPELFRAGLAMGAELYALGACWPKVRQHHWRALLIARAIENQAFVLGCNRVGRDPAPRPASGGAGGLEYAGGSIAVSPLGEVLGELDDRAGVLSVEIDPRAVRSWREKFPAWNEAGR